MSFLIATLLYTGTVVAEENLQEKMKTHASFYIEKNTYIKYQQEWQMNLYKKRIKEFKNDPKCLLVIKKNEKFSRNEKCPATGKKYKHCCGAL